MLLDRERQQYYNECASFLISFLNSLINYPILVTSYTNDTAFK